MAGNRAGIRAETKRAWDDVGAGCTELGGKLKTHFEQVRQDDDAQATEALRKLVDAVGDAFEAVGHAARDPGMRAEARKVAGTLTNALGATFADMGDEVRKVFKRDAAPGETPPPGDGPAGGGPAGDGPADGGPAG